MFDPVVAERRFGTGRSPVVAAPTDGAMMVARLARDLAAPAWPVEPFVAHVPALKVLRDLGAARRTARAGAEADAADDAYKEARRGFRRASLRGLKAAVARGITTQDGFRERLTWFWADHFTAVPTAPGLRHLGAAFIEDAIRPHLTGRFADMLRAVVTHPIMLVYLDQHVSVGPSTALAKRRGRGLNENLAREILELHTLGVDGRYTQGDGFELAKLLAGLSTGPRAPFLFRRNLIEPGAEEVLGQRYAGDDLAAVDAAPPEGRWVPYRWVPGGTIEAAE